MFEIGARTGSDAYQRRRRAGYIAVSLTIESLTSIYVHGTGLIIVIDAVGQPLSKV